MNASLFKRPIINPSVRPTTTRRSRADVGVVSSAGRRACPINKCRSGWRPWTPCAATEWRSFPCSDEGLQEAAEAFREDGAVCIRGAFSDEWLQVVAKGIEANQSSPSELGEWIGGGGDGGSRFFSDLASWKRIPQFESFARHAGAARIARLMMGSQVAALYHEHVLVKEEGLQPATPWHQDQSYYPVDGRHLCSIWLPVDPIKQEVSLEFVRGSHDWGRWFVPRKFASGNDYQRLPQDASPGDRRYERVPDIEADPDLKQRIISWETQPGDCVVFHGMAIHGTRSNQPASHRRVLSTRWVGEDAEFQTRPWVFSPPGIMGSVAFGERLISDREQFPSIDVAEPGIGHPDSSDLAEQ